MRRALAASSFVAVIALHAHAHAQQPAPASTDEKSDADKASATLQVDLEKDKKPVATEPDGPPLEAPPPVPYKKSVVLDSSLGAMAFLGQFGKTAPTAPWLHTQLGYEILSWLMLYGEGELAFTDTSGTQKPPKTRAFPIFGFGGGARFTLHVTERVGIYAQGGLGAMKADIANRALTIIGFNNAETLGMYVGGRLGFEWYQLDRHFALGLNVGLRRAGNFAKTGGASDNALALDGGAALRYAF